MNETDRRDESQVEGKNAVIEALRAGVRWIRSILPKENRIRPCGLLPKKRKHRAP